MGRFERGLAKVQQALDGEWCPLCGADEDILTHDCQPSFANLRGFRATPGMFVAVVPPAPALEPVTSGNLDLDELVAMAGSWTP